MHQKEQQAREYIVQLEKKREYIHAWVDEATVDQLTGMIREIARQVLAGSIAATGKTDKKKKSPIDRKKAQLCCRLDRRDAICCRTSRCKHRSFYLIGKPPHQQVDLAKRLGEGTRGGPDQYIGIIFRGVARRYAEWTEPAVARCHRPPHTGRAIADRARSGAVCLTC